MSNEYFKKVKIRMMHTARLEKLINQGASYSKILKESRILDKLILEEMKIRLKKS